MGISKDEALQIGSLFASFVLLVYSSLNVIRLYFWLRHFSSSSVAMKVNKKPKIMKKFLDFITFAYLVLWF